MYKLNKDTGLNQIISVIRLSDKTFIPLVEDNTDYQEYLKWVAEGGVPLPADE